MTRDEIEECWRAILAENTYLLPPVISELANGELQHHSETFADQEADVARAHPGLITGICRMMQTYRMVGASRRPT